jgi:hypothetical protein
MPCLLIYVVVLIMCAIPATCSSPFRPLLEVQKLRETRQVYVSVFLGAGLSVCNASCLLGPPSANQAQADTNKHYTAVGYSTPRCGSTGSLFLLRNIVFLDIPLWTGHSISSWCPCPQIELSDDVSFSIMNKLCIEDFHSLRTCNWRRIYYTIKFNYSSR